MVTHHRYIDRQPPSTPAINQINLPLKELCLYCLLWISISLNCEGRFDGDGNTASNQINVNANATHWKCRWCQPNPLRLMMLGNDHGVSTLPATKHGWRVNPHKTIRCPMVITLILCWFLRTRRWMQIRFFDTKVKTIASQRVRPPDPLDITNIM